MSAAEDPDRLVGVLSRQRGRGLLGPDPISAQIAHARVFAAAVPSPRRAVDLGSGGGVPGLVLASVCWPDAELVLLDASQRRCTFLELAVADLGVADRVRVVWGRAEELGRDEALRGRADVVVARSFGPPAATAECAAPLLVVGGCLVVSEPPGSDASRWEPTGLARLGLGPAELLAAPDGAVVRLTQRSPCPDEFPRRTGVPVRRPLFDDVDRS